MSRKSCFLHLRGQMKREATSCSDISVPTDQLIRLYISEYLTLQHHRFDSLNLRPIIFIQIQKET